MTSAQLCRRNGWKRGTILRSKRRPSLGIVITAVGDAEVLAFEIVEPDRKLELLWDLTLDDWRQLGRIVAPKRNLGTRRN